MYNYQLHHLLYHHHIIHHYHHIWCIWHNCTISHSFSLRRDIVDRSARIIIVIVTVIIKEVIAARRNGLTMKICQRVFNLGTIQHQAYHSFKSHTQSYWQLYNGSVRGIYLSGGSQRNIHPKYFIDDQNRSLQLSDLYQQSSGVHPLDIPDHICLTEGRSTFYSPQ